MEEKVLFECRHIDDLAKVDTSSSTPIFDNDSDFRIQLVEYKGNNYKFATRYFRNGKWEYNGFGHSGAASVVSALLDENQRLKQALEKIQERTTFANSYKSDVLDVAEDVNVLAREALNIK